MADNKEYSKKLSDAFNNDEFGFKFNDVFMIVAQQNPDTSVGEVMNILKSTLGALGVYHQDGPLHLPITIPIGDEQISSYVKFYDDLNISTPMEDANAHKIKLIEQAVEEIEKESDEENFFGRDHGLDLLDRIQTILEGEYEKAE